MSTRVSAVALSLLIAASVLMGRSVAGQAPSVTVHVGVARAEWLSRGEWATAAGIDFRPVRRDAFSLIIGAHGLFNQFTPGTGLTRRQSVGTALVGGEFRVLQTRRLSASVGSALAASYWWYRYRPTRALTPSGHEFDAFGLVSGVRIESVRMNRPALSIRADVRTTFLDNVSWSPQLGVGLAF